MTGNEVKQLIQSAGLKCWQVAELWGVNDGNFSRRLRRSFNDEEVKPVYRRYEFLEDGSGTYYEPDGNAQQISWSVTADGGMKLIYDDNGEISELYDFIGCDMVTSKDTPEGKREIHIAKVPVFTVDEKN